MIALPPSFYAIAAGTVVALAGVGWIGYEIGASGAFQKGRESGIASATAECAAEKRLISATSHNEADRIRRENDERVHAIETADAARATQVRLTLAANDASRLREFNAALERVRVAEQAATKSRDHLPDGSGGLPRAADAAPGGRGSGGASPWILHPGGAEDFIRLAARADGVADLLAACRASIVKRQQAVK